MWTCTQRSVAVSLVPLVLLLLTATASAQAVITGVVRDASGAVLPGVTVEAASPALIEKVRSVVPLAGVEQDVRRNVRLDRTADPGGVRAATGHLVTVRFGPAVVASLDEVNAGRVLGRGVMN